MITIYYLAALFFFAFNFMVLANFSKVWAFLQHHRLNPKADITATQTTYVLLSSLEFCWWLTGLVGPLWLLIVSWLLLHLVLSAVTKRYCPMAFALNVGDLLLILFVFANHFHLHWVV